MGTHKVNKTIHIKFLAAEGCSECENAKRIIEEAKKTLPTLQLDVEEIDVSGFKGLELAIKYSIMENPGIIINNELFSTGHLDREKFMSKLLSL